MATLETLMEDPEATALQPAEVESRKAIDPVELALKVCAAGSRIVRITTTSLNGNPEGIVGRCQRLPLPRYEGEPQDISIEFWKPPHDDDIVTTTFSVSYVHNIEPLHNAGCID